MPNNPANEVRYRARWIAPMVAPVIENGMVEVMAGRITRVGSAWGSESGVTDLGDVVLLPALINCHTHLEFSDLDRPLGARGMPFVDWIRLVIDSRRQRTAADDARTRGLRESREAGVALLGEIATTDLALPTSPVDAVVFRESIGFQAAVADARAQETETFLQRFSSAGENRMAGISPHAPYTVHWKLLERLVEQSVRRQVPVAMHLAESAEEMEFVTHQTGPFRELLESVGAWDPTALAVGRRSGDYLEPLSRTRALVVHGNYLSASDWEFLASHRRRMTVVYCPRTHDWFEHPRYPLIEMLNRGVAVALGTDSRASNPDLNLWGELRHVARVFPQLAAAEVLDLATRAAADALGRRAWGRLQPGATARLIAATIDPSAGDPLENLLRGEAPPSVQPLGW